LTKGQLSPKRSARRPGRKTAGALAGNSKDLEVKKPSLCFPIVGIGASAGGLEAFTEWLKHLPVDTGMGFVLVQHLDPQHKSGLTQLLARVTSMPVREWISG
jgi:two-component system CheB/CheR fusion protein